MKHILLNLYFRLRRRAEEFHRFYEPQYLKYLHGSTVQLAEDVDLGINFVMRKPGKATTLEVGKGCLFRNNTIITLAEKGHLTIGAHNFFNNGCSINCLGRIVIGDHNLFGENVKLYDHNHRFANLEEHIADQGMSVGGITIGNNCWLGSNIVVLNNVTIGDNVVIGANNLIYKSIPSNTIVKANATASLTERKHQP